MKLTLLIAVLISAPLMRANGSTIKIVDANGDPFANVLIIVRSLDGKGEIGRYLTNGEGLTSKLQLDDDGLYRIIATCPYGLCQTTVREFIGTDIHNELVITVP